MKIAILVTTFLRDDLLKIAVKKMLQYLPPNTSILIGDQSGPQSMNTLDKVNSYSNEPCSYYQLPFNCGLSFARNFLLEQAVKQGCEYVVLASDSFIFNEKTDIITALPALCKYDIVGFNLIGAKIYWVGDLNLIPNKCYTLDFADRDEENPAYETFGDIRVLPCSIIHNFFIARADVLYDVQWDDRLVMAEHEDFFFRLKQKGAKVGWTPNISCEYRKTREGVHGRYRDANWRKGMQTLLEKHHLQSWIQYTNLHLGRIGGVDPDRN